MNHTNEFQIFWMRVYSLKNYGDIVVFDCCLLNCFLPQEDVYFSKFKITSEQLRGESIQIRFE